MHFDAKFVGEIRRVKKRLNMVSKLTEMAMDRENEMHAVCDASHEIHSSFESLSVHAN